MDNIKEKIESAAVQYHFLGDDKKRVVKFPTHSDCYRQLIAEEIWAKRPVKVDKECYLTNCGRYVDSKEAKDIAYAAGQLPKSYPYDVLYPNQVDYLRIK